jgi:hypothetical protein
MENTEQNETPPVRESPVNIGRYNDPEGLSVGKMELGLAYVKHKKNLVQAWYLFLALIIAATWGYYFFVVGEYLAFGMRNDNVIAAQLVAGNFPGHDFFVEKSPRDLQVDRVRSIKTDKGTQDFFVKLVNPNADIRAEFDYYFDSGGKQFGKGKGSVMPGQARYLLALNSDTSNSSANLVIENLSWIRLNRHEIPDWDKFRIEGLDIEIKGAEFTPARSTSLTEKVNLNTLQFKAINHSPYNYAKANFIIFLNGHQGESGVNEYTADRLMSGEERQVNMTWTGQIPSVREIKIIPNIDLFDKKNYLKF